MQRQWVGAFGLTEPGAGTDAQGQQTFAVDEGDHWKLNGSDLHHERRLCQCVHHHCRHRLCHRQRGRKQKEISAFIVERTDPGFKVASPGQDGHPRFFHLRAHHGGLHHRRIVCWA
ncbi:MAG: acyl-CoA dehydrogenase family protein [Gemmiger formicilis]|uniref:acyl-CoA dehydrogenase family protein n=1 Tax=Gemmiger formicilis TaxID=745368 RepID=UPI003A32547B